MPQDLTPELNEVRDRLRTFINDAVIPAEAELTDDPRGELMGQLKAQAKSQGLWALGHPADIGGQGIPFMPFVFMNEIIGRSRFGSVAVGSMSMQDSIMLNLYASDETARALAQASRSGRDLPLGRTD